MKNRFDMGNGGFLQVKLKLFLDPWIGIGEKISVHVHDTYEF